MKALALALLVVSSARVAFAEPDPSPGSDAAAPYLVIGVVALDLALTIHDLTTIGDDTSTIYGVAETALTVPQVFVFGAISMLDPETEFVAWFALWTAGLATHGIVTIASGDGDVDGDPEAPRMVSFGGRF